MGTVLAGGAGASLVDPLREHPGSFDVSVRAASYRGHVAVDL